MFDPGPEDIGKVVLIVVEEKGKRFKKRGHITHFNNSKIYVKIPGINYPKPFSKSAVELDYARLSNLF